MSSTATWTDDNQRYLAAALRQLRDVIARVDGKAADDGSLAELAAGMGRPPALRALRTTFGLSPFETDVLLLCAGCELDTEFHRAVRRAGAGDGDGHAGAGAGQPWPTFGMALALLPGAHWSALAPSAPLRRWRLLETTPGVLLTHGPLRAAERVVHFLAGVQTLDAEIEGLVTIVEGTPELAPTHAQLAERAVRAFAAATAGPGGSLPLGQLIGRDEAARDVGTSIARSLGFSAAVLHAEDLPTSAVERERLARLWEREAVLSNLLLLVDCTSVADDPAADRNVVRFLEQLASPTLAHVRQPLAELRGDDIRLVVETPPVCERLAAWRCVLPEPDPELGIERIAGQFPMTSPQIHAAVGELALREPRDPLEAGRVLWDLCRERSRPRLDHLTDRMTPSAAWDDLVLPDQQKQLLREIVGHARLRHRVYGSWGFAEKNRRGLGISALFAGPSGTGKTMAAEVLSEELRLDMYRIDLGRVVSKYIGETEKNLGRIFDEAEAAGGVILLFDEADALFGKRTEVRDSHDRYANLEVSYLLQQMEAYDGLAILTTNLKSALDPAFLRRIRFVVQFPFPDLSARTQIWRGAFPSATPTDGLHYERLARLNVAGGNIRNIALNAAFASAATGGPVEMSHVLAAARSEYAKLERPLPDAEIRGWA